MQCILGQKKLSGYAISKSPPSGGCKWLDPAKFNLDKYGDGSLRGWVQKFIFNVLNNCMKCTAIIPQLIFLLVMLKNDFLTSSTKKVHVSLQKLAILFRTRIKKKKGTLCILEFDQSKQLKAYINFNAKKITEAEKIMTEIEKHPAN